MPSLSVSRRSGYLPVPRQMMTAFTGIVLALSAVGIRWTSQHQPPASAVASAAVLGISSTFAVVALVIIWRGTGK